MSMVHRPQSAHGRLLFCAALSAAALLVVFTLTSHAANTIDWQPASSGLPTTGLVRDVAFGDVNNDGKPDLAIAYVGGQGLAVYAGNGAGLWSSSGMTVGLPSTGMFERLALGDLNSDGKLDLVATGASNNGVQAYVGNGAGTWTVFTTGLPITGSHTGVALGDVNRDGRPDILVGTNGGTVTGLRVYLNTGSSFSQTTSVTTTGGYNEVAVGYVDDDGFLDVAAGNAGNGIFFWRGTATGWLLASTGLSTTPGYRGVTIGDINNDGKPDLITSRQGFAGPTGGGLFAYLWNETTNSWTSAPNPIPVTASYGQLALAEINNDGWLDLIAGGFPTQGTLGVYAWLGNASGFTAAPSPTTTGSLPAVTIADLDRDGLLDVAAGDNAGAGVPAWRNNGVRDAVGSWTAIASPQTTGSPRALAIADLDRDGYLDVVVARESGGLNSWLGNGGNSWTDCNLAADAITGTYESVITGRFDRNSQYPVVIGARTDSGGIRLFTNRSGSCLWDETLITGTGSYQAIAAGDIDNDAYTDLIAAAFTGGLRHWEDGPNGWFAQPNPIATGTYRDVALGDFNHDGQLDIAAADSGGSGVTVLLAGRTWASSVVTATGEFHAIAVGDLNNDGHPDIAAAKNGSAGEQGVYLWLNDGTGTAWTPLSSPATAGQYFDLDLGDFDHDGRLDLLAARDGLGVMVWANAGAGSWTSANTNLPTSGAFFNSLFGPIDRDGNLDLLSTELNAGVRMWTSAEASPPSFSNFQPSGWVSTTQSPGASASVIDSVSGISVTSGLYRYSTNGGGSWSATSPAGVTGSNGSTTTQVISVASVPFNQDSATQNLVELQVADRVGNVGTLQSIVKIDTTPPTAPTALMSFDHVTGTWSNDNSISIGWSGASDATSGVHSYSVLFDQSPATLPDTTSETAASSYTSGFLGDGNNWYAHVRARDVAGNWSTTAKHLGPFWLDTTPPNNPTSFSGSHTLSVWSNDPTIFISWSGATDGSGSGVFGYSYVWDTSPGTLPDAAYDTTGNSATSPALSSGSNKYFHIRTRDVAGNWSAAAQHRGPYYIDTTPPSSSASSPATTGSTSFLVSWSGSDAHSGVANYDVQSKDISAGGSWTTWKSAIASTSATFTGQGGHIYQFRSRARDNAGNVEAYPVTYDSQTVIATLDFFVKNPGIEVNQGVQDLSNSVTPIAGKRTFVRCYVQSVSGTHNNVPARLRVYRGATLMGTLVPSNSGGAITLRTAPDRNDLNHAYYFDVPIGWLSAGSVRFECEVNTPQKYGESDYTDNTRSTTLSFVNAPAMNLVIVDVPYKIGGTTYHVRDLDRNRLAKWLRNAYPINMLSVKWAYLDPPYNGLPTAATVNSDMFWARVSNPTQFFNDWWARYYGMAIDTGGFMRGKAMGIPSIIASGPTGPTGGWDTDGSFGDWYGGHELGHTYGRKHVTGAPYAGSGGCGDEAGPDGSYPYGSGFISPGTSAWASNTKYGLDWSDMGVRVITPNWYDVMTYCQPQWISDYTYEAIYNRMVAEKPVPFIVFDTPQATTTAEHLVVMTTILTPTDVITLNTFYRLPNSEDLATSPPGDYHIRLLDAGNGLLADHAITPYFSPETDEPEGSIAEMVPWITGTHKIVITHGTAALITRTVSASTPAVTITSPNGGENLSGGNVTVNWTASDADGDPLTFSIDYSRDGGATWESVSGQITTTQATLDLGLLPGTTQGKFRVWVSDGVNTSNDASDGTFSVGFKLPEIVSIEPISGTTYVLSQTVTFEGVAFDVEDGLLGDTQLQWSSSLQGALGTGGMLQTTGLITGTHVITLQATDHHANSVAAITVITVVGEPTAWQVYLPVVLRDSSN